VFATTPCADPLPLPTATPGPTIPAPTTVPAGPTIDGAITRYEQLLHALGSGNVATICEIAGKAIEKQNPGLGSCDVIAPTVMQFLSAEQKQAYRSATVDPTKVTANGTTVRIPASAVRADVALTEDDIGDAIMSHMDGQWYATELIE
jgi:hypothetical protein